MSSETRPADIDLVNRIRGGDLTAFEDVYRQHGPRLYNVVLRLVGSPADAEDVLQEVFLLAFRKLASFRGEAALGTWLHRLAVNASLDRLRSRGARESQRTEGFEPGTAGPVDRQPPSGEVVVSRLDLERAIALLPDGYRAAFVLHDVEGFDHREVGGILGISEGTSKSQVHKARLRLRELLMPVAHGAPSPGRPEAAGRVRT
jgi:RNA polymerase sigma-70 factor (ECF subfamily)